MSSRPLTILPPSDTPRATFIFIQTLLGTLRIAACDETHEIREGDILLFPGDLSYSIENPGVRDAAALLFTASHFKS